MMVVTAAVMPGLSEVSLECVAVDVGVGHGGPVEHGRGVRGGEDVGGAHPVAVGIISTRRVGLGHGVLGGAGAVRTR